MTSDLIERLEGYRQAHNLTYAQLAAQLEIPETYFYRWRKKKCINGIYAKYISNVLDQRELAVK
jgi:transcriptional regulator with XRE-family HTH domain